MKRGSFFLMCVLLIGFSCSIIDDSDIVKDDVINLNLKSILLSQFIQDGKEIIGIAEVITNSQNQISEITWPNLDANSMFQFKVDPSNTITGNVTTIFEYDDLGRVEIVSNEFNATIFQGWRYSYDQLGRLDTVFSGYDLNLNLNSIITVDIISYTGSRVDSIRRIELLDLNFNRIISFNPNYQDNFIRSVNFQPIVFGISIPDRTTFDVCDFQNPPDLNCQNRIFFEGVGNVWSARRLGLNGGLVPIMDEVGNVIIEMDLIDFRFSGEQGPDPNRLPDHYYFNPFWVFPDLFPQDRAFSAIYMADWWFVNDQKDISFSYEVNQVLSLEFIY